MALSGLMTVESMQLPYHYGGLMCKDRSALKHFMKTFKISERRCSVPGGHALPSLRLGLMHTGVPIDRGKSAREAHAQAATS